MLIDFHSHLFPDAVAPRAIDALVAGSFRCEGRELLPRGDATEQGMLLAMRRECVPLSVILPIVTRPAQFESILSFAERLNRQNVEKLALCREAFAKLSAVRKEREASDRVDFSVCLPTEEEKNFFEALGGGALVSFASVHPDDPAAEDQLEIIAERGFRGIKLHPEFQHFEISSPRAISLLRKAESLGLYTVIHAGRDIGFPPPAHAAPAMIAHALEYIEGSHLIAAHLGGFRMWDDVEKYLVGKNLYLDTAYLGIFDGEPTRAQYLRILRSHGADKILFGSDYPWKSARETVACLLSLGLSAEELNLIFYRNAAKLLFS